MEAQLELHLGCCRLRGQGTAPADTVPWRLWATVTVTGPSKHLFANQKGFSDADGVTSEPSAVSVEKLSDGRTWLLAGTPKVCLTCKVPLNEKEFSELATSEMAVTLRWAADHDGSGSPPADAVVLGRSKTALALILDGRTEWTEEATLTTDDTSAAGPPSWLDTSAAGASTIAVSLVADTEFADYALGGAILRPSAVRVANLPASWEAGPPLPVNGANSGATDAEFATQEAWEAAVSTAVAGSPGKRFAYSVAWPAVAENSPNGNGVVSLQLPTVLLTEGALTYRPVTPAAVGTGGVSGGNEGGGGSTNDGEVASVLRKGAWTVDFDGSKCSAAAAFLHRSALRQLTRNLKDGHLLPVRLERVPNVSDDAAAAAAAAAAGKGGKSGAAANAAAGAAKAGGGKGAGKSAAGKSGAVEEDNSNPGSDAPWRLVGWVDLGSLASTPDLQTLDGASCSLSCVPADASVASARRESAASALDSSDAAAASAPSAEEQQKAEVAGAGTTISLSLSLSRPLVRQPRCLARAEELKDVLPLPVPPPPPVAAPRDVSAEIRTVLGELIARAGVDYISLRNAAAADNAEVSGERLQEQLLEALASAGVVDAFQERLGPLAAAAVVEDFGQHAEEPAEAAQLASRLYARLMEEAMAALNAKIDAAKAQHVDTAAPVHPSASHAPLSSTDYAQLAASAAAAGDWEAAAIRHQDAIDVATAAAVEPNTTEAAPWLAWANYAEFHVHNPAADLEAAAAAYKIACQLCREASYGTSNSVSSCDVVNQHCGLLAEFGAVLLEAGRSDKALGLLETARDATPRRGLALDEVLRTQKSAARELVAEDAAGYDSDDAAERCSPLLLCLLCLAEDACGQAQEARRALSAAIKSARFAEITLSTPEAHGAEVDRADEFASSARQRPPPRRTAVAALQACCAWLLDRGLHACASRALAMSELCEAAVVEKARRRGATDGCPLPLRAGCRVLQARVRCCCGSRSAEELEAAAELAAEAAELLADAEAQPDWIARAHLARAQALDAQNDAAGACAAYGEAAALLEGVGSGGCSISGESDSGAAGTGLWEVGLSPARRLRLWLRLGALLAGQARHAEARDVYLTCLKSCFTSKGSSYDACVGAGMACMRLEQWEEASKALQAATSVDPRRPAAWGALALLSLLSVAASVRADAAPPQATALEGSGSVGKESGEVSDAAKLLEADAALRQALRLGLRDTALLRELGCALMTVGRLPAAEDLLRRSLACAGEAEQGREASLHARRCLADVLAAQNAVSQAVREYELVIFDRSVPPADRDSAWDACAALLRSVGREHEMSSWPARLAQASCGDSEGVTIASQMYAPVAGSLTNNAAENNHLDGKMSEWNGAGDGPECAGSSDGGCEVGA